MAESTAFSTAGEDVITRSIDISADETGTALAPDIFNDYYEITRTAEEIERGNYKRIALQFPDELLHDSVPIFRALKRRIAGDRELYVLADTSYGSCCVDEVAASHAEADAMVHYGHACMSKTYRLPVIYVFGKKPIDLTNCVDQLVGQLGTRGNEKTLLLRNDVAYTHIMDNVQATLAKVLPNSSVLYSPPPTLSRQDDASAQPTSANDLATRMEDHIVLYIGPESLGLTNLLMTHSMCEVYSYDPTTRAARLESARTNKLLMRRYAVVQRARDADVFGIVVGTLGVASYLPLIKHLRNLLRRGRKKSYTISVGKLNPAKLGNFLEIECFVLVACPENSIIGNKDGRLNVQEFLRPIVTPFELEVALKAEESWTGRYVLDFEMLLGEHTGEDHQERAEEVADEDNEAVDPDQPVFSLISGTYRHARRYGDSGEPTNSSDPLSTAVAIRSTDNAVATLADSAAGEFLLNRTWQGLERRLGEDAPSVLEQGRSGIARGYADDHV